MLIMFTFKKSGSRAKSLASEVTGHATSSKSSTVDSILRLQQAIGNRGLFRLLRADPADLRVGTATAIQPKLTISTPQDASEHEADRIADQVMNTPDMERPEAEGADKPRPSAEGQPHSSGQPLDQRTRAFFESRFGEDFSGVRVHTDARAADSARSLSAQAYTVGQDVVFGSGHYSPHTTRGRLTLAHELAHVVQQRPTARRARAKSLGLAHQPAQLQRKLVLTGTSADVNRVVAIMNQGLGPIYAARVNAAGEVEILSSGFEGPPTRENQFFTARLRLLVGESGTTTVGVVAGGTPIVGSYALAQIDVADMEALGVGQVGWDARASLLHELAEQRETQLGSTAAQRAYGSPTTGAHGQGLAAELGMIGAALESDTGLVSATTNGDGTMNGTRTVVFLYPNGSRFRIEVTLSHNNITGVIRTRLP